MASMSELDFRHLTKDSLDDYVDVVARARDDDPYERRLSHEEAMELTFLDSDFDAKGSWLAYLDGRAVGSCVALVLRNRIKAGMDDAYVDIDVIPERRGVEVEDRLLQMALEYIASRGVGNALSRGLVGDSWRSNLLKTYSFRESYRVYILVRHGTDRVGEHGMPDEFRLERRAFDELSNGEISELVELFNDSFRDHINFAPEREERFINWRDCSEEPRMLTLARTGSRAVGFCLSEESTALNQEKGINAGWIEILGVRSPCRRKGLGTALLADGVNWLLGRGLNQVYLGMYAKNEKALGLYADLGFVKDRESVWYRRALNDDARRAQDGNEAESAV